MNVYTVRQFRMNLKQALDNAPCNVVRGEEKFELRKVESEYKYCKQGHPYRGDKCLQPGCMS